MTDDKSNRDLLILAILAFDLMISDCIEDLEEGSEFHPLCRTTLEHLERLLNNRPKLNDLRSQYIVNLSEISARIKLLFLARQTGDADVERVIKIQEENLKLLGKWAERDSVDDIGEDASVSDGKVLH